MSVTQSFHHDHEEGLGHFVQRQTVVTAYFSSKQLQLFVFARA